MNMDVLGVLHDSGNHHICKCHSDTTVNRVLEGLLCENIKDFSKKHDGTLGFKQPNVLERWRFEQILDGRK